MLKNIFSLMLSRTHAAVAALAEAGRVPAGLDTSRIVVEPPRDPAHGDMATNAAMVLAKDAALKPRELAEAIAVELRKDALVDKVEVAGPGFINLTLKPAAWIGELRAMIEAGADYGKSDIGKAEPVNVEYVSANPPARCMSATGAARYLATRSRTCSPSPVSRLRASTTSTGLIAV
jgi:arginyl-tRNA synthetase